MPEEVLNTLTIATGLATRFIGQNVICYSSVGSTIEIARQKALGKITEGTAVIAECQTVGRGRLKRAWMSPEGCIALSIILYPKIEHLPSLTMLASLAVKHSIEKTTGLKCQLKWPNDVLIEGKKVSGILLESQIKAGRVEYAILSAGINVNINMANYPELAQFATSLADEMGKEVSREALIRCLFVETERLYLRLSSGESLLPEWREQLITLGNRVHVRLGDDVYEGTAESIAEDGGLLLRGSDGKLMKFMAGDVTLR